MASFDLLDRLKAPSHRGQTEVLEHKPVRERVAQEDIVRMDGLGRTVVAVTKGTAPPSWVALTAAERASLVEPPPPPSQGHLHPGPYGFSPEGIVMRGFTLGPG